MPIYYFLSGIDGTSLRLFSVLNNLGQAESQMFPVTAGGSNFFTLTTDVAQSMSRIQISGVDLTDVRQIRIGGVNVIPEPSAVVLFGTGLSAVIIAACPRRRRQP